MCTLVHWVAYKRTEEWNLGVKTILREHAQSGVIHTANQPATDNAEDNRWDTVNQPRHHQS